MKLLKDILITLICLLLATLFSFICLHITHKESVISIIYVLAIVITSHLTRGYIFGILSALIAVIEINYFFYYPYFALNFSLDGYPLTFAILLSISLITSTLTTHSQQQTKIANEHQETFKQLYEFNTRLLSSTTSLTTLDITIQYIEEVLHKKAYIENHPYQDTPNSFPLGKNYTLYIEKINAKDETIIRLLCQQSSLTLDKQALQLKHHQLTLEAEKETMRANLLRAISHDLRTPLTNMIGASATYLESEDTLDKNQKHHLISSIHEDSIWLLRMVENLLSVTRIKDQSTKVNKTPEPVEEVVAEAIQKVKKHYPHALIKVQVPEEYLQVDMDAILIEQVLINLIENAMKYANSSSPIELTVTNKEDRVYFSVLDHGVGLDPAMIENIFEMKKRTDTSKGMGIGLSICKTIIDAHEGKIKATTHASGCEFSFWLPNSQRS